MGNFGNSTPCPILYGKKKKDCKMQRWTKKNACGCCESGEEYVMFEMDLPSTVPWYWKLFFGDGILIPLGSPSNKCGTAAS